MYAYEYISICIIAFHMDMSDLESYPKGNWISQITCIYMGIFDIQYQLRRYGILYCSYLLYPWGIGDINYPAFPVEYWTWGVWDIQHHILMTMRVFDANYASWIWRYLTSNTPHGGMDFTYNIIYIHKGYEIPNILHIQRDIGYPISTITIWGTVCLISAISMEDRGNQLSCITRGTWDRGRMGYPTSHPNDYWPFNTSHVHSGILYTQYRP